MLGQLKNDQGRLFYSFLPWRGSSGQSPGAGYLVSSWSVVGACWASALLFEDWSSLDL